MCDEIKPDKSIEEYFEKFGMPWLIEHLKMRSIGLQVFTAIQGGLIIGWVTISSKIIAFAALITCVSFYFWDQRVKNMLTASIKFGEKYIDIPRFGKKAEGATGIFTKIECSRKVKLRVFKFFEEGSHTLAIRILILGLVCLWMYMIISNW